MAYKTILFDVDGTLCDPGKSLIECARYALGKFDIHETDDANLRRLIGPPLEHAFRDYYNFDKEQTDQAVEYFREMMQREGVQLYEVYPGIRELLEKLKQADKTVAVVTSKIDHIAREVLTNTDLVQYFDVISAQQPHVVVEKEAILAKALSDLGVTDLSTTVMIGDRKHDIEAAKIHGIDSIGVLWGYGDKKEFQSEDATCIVDNTDELSQLLIN